jgi:hypothetical protein
MALEVIGSGLGRTGTMTMKVALEQLGYGPCYHMIEVFSKPDAPRLWSDAADGKPDWEAIFQGYRSTVDWPNATFYLELANAYPNAKIIHTERDPEAWWTSTQATIFAERGGAPSVTNPEWLEMARKVVFAMFDQQIHDKERVISVFNAHNRRVRETIAPERLLIYEVAQGWEPLCAFLGVPVPDGPMPKVNTTEDFRARIATHIN